MVRYHSTIRAAAVIQLIWASSATASFIDLPLHDLLLRGDSSCATNYTSCGSSYPSNFCCSSNTTCLGLDSGSTILCCPTGQNCTYIEPISCDIQALNATLYPDAPIKSSDLTGDLPSCAGECCPFGYTCAKNTTCVLDVSTSSEANSTSTASASISSSSTTTTATAAVSTISDIAVTSATTSVMSIGDASPAKSTSTSSITLSSSQTNGTTCQKFSAEAVAAGFFPGTLAGAMAAAIIMICRRRRRQSEDEVTALKAHRSSKGAIIGISDPIPDDENGSFRTDFLLRRKLSGRYPGPGSISRPKSKILRKTGTRVKSIFIGANNNNSNSNETNSPQWNSASPPPIPPVPTLPAGISRVPAARQLPVTPPQQTDRLPPRQSGTESIKVYSPPNMLGIDPGRRQDRNTTFSDVIAQAGFQNDKGEPSYRLAKTPTSTGQSPGQKK